MSGNRHLGFESRSLRFKRAEVRKCPIELDLRTSLFSALPLSRFCPGPDGPSARRQPRLRRSCRVTYSCQSELCFARIASRHTIADRRVRRRPARGSRHRAFARRPQNWHRCRTDRQMDGRLEMSSTQQKRDLSDPAVVDSYAGGNGATVGFDVCFSSDPGTEPISGLLETVSRQSWAT